MHVILRHKSHIIPFWSKNKYNFYNNDNNSKGQNRKQRFNIVNVLTISAAFLMILSTINLSSSSSYLPLLSSPFTNKAKAASISDVAFGGGGGGWLNFLNNGALQSWYSQCLASLGTTAASSGLPTTTNGVTNPFIGGTINTNNGLTSTTSTDSCAQQLQSYINQLLSSFQQCIMSATMGGGFGGGVGGVGFSMAMRECAMLMLEQQQLQNGLQTPNTGNSNLINGLGINNNHKPICNHY
jgi:hypothetical protein